jgi:hypothetical protein
MEFDAAVHTALLQQLCTLQAAANNIRAKFADESALLEDLNALTTSAFAGCKVDEPAPEGSTALLKVCAQGVLADAQLLLDGARRAEVPTVSIECCVSAAAVGTRRGGSPTGDDCTGTSAFFYACHGGHLEVAQLLLSLGGVDVNQARTNVGVGDAQGVVHPTVELSSRSRSWYRYIPAFLRSQ